MKFSKAEIDAIIAASPRTFIPFNKLVLSQDYQARAGGSTPKLSTANSRPRSRKAAYCRI
ncbi:hypothetical protein [Accumulibacter sp.]|uniref:hypothetical protein n=1 Tax=Betaproteobacteria TaxID=28216 RepID=UPI002633D565|nr:hypothetical protein [Accumulibacter sp.]